MRRAVLPILVALCASCGGTIVWHSRSPNRERLVSVREDSGGQTVVHDGDAHATHRGIGISGIVFSPDSRRLAYPAERGDGQWVVVVDRKQSSEEVWDGIGAIVFSPNSQRVAYLAERRGAWHVVCDGISIGAAHSIFAGTLGFSPDGARLAWVEAGEPGARVVVDGDPAPYHDAIAGLTFSVDGRIVGYAARDGTVWRAVVGDQSGPPYDHIARLEFGPNDRVAYAGVHGEETVVVIDGETVAAHAAVRPSTLAFLASGELLYVAHGEVAEHVFVAGSSGPAFEEVTELVVGPKARRWGYLGRAAGRFHVVLDGEEVVPAGVWAANLVLSPDGVGYAFVSQNDRLKRVVHANGEFAHDVVLPGSLAFGRDGDSLGYVAGDLSTEELHVYVDGDARAKVRIEELNMNLMTHGNSIISQLLDRVRAELKGR